MTQYLSRRQVGALIDIDAHTVTIYRRRYEGTSTPFPEPDIHIGSAPGWSMERTDEIKAWAASRPGRWGKATADG